MTTKKGQQQMQTANGKCKQATTTANCNINRNGELFL
jgi:hypothetical protein